MRPGQLQPNDLEHALIERLIAESDLSLAFPDLHVLSRKYTGVGYFTEFIIKDGINTPATTLHIRCHIDVPQLKHGLGAVAFYHGDSLELELFAYGDEHWDGTYEGFQLADAQR